MDEISIKDVLVSVGENINPARDLIGSDDLKSNTVEFVLTKTYFENLGILMQEYLSTTSIGDLIRKARGHDVQKNITLDDVRGLLTPEAPATRAESKVGRNLS
jgi:Rrf2 family iron-sulfur cluster assembly transcriptional regulator